MAIWQFDFHLVPRREFERQFGTIPVTISEEYYKEIAWWTEVSLLEELNADFSTLLPKGSSWDSQSTSWGTEDGDRIDVLREDHGIAEVFGRLDTRTLSLPFLNCLVEIARRHDLLIVTESRHVLRPSVKELLAAIRRSPSFAFVRDPEGFLRLLSGAD